VRPEPGETEIPKYSSMTEKAWVPSDKKREVGSERRKKRFGEKFLFVKGSRLQEKRNGKKRGEKPLPHEQNWGAELGDKKQSKTTQSPGSGGENVVHGN